MALVVGLKTAASVFFLSHTRNGHPDVMPMERIPGRINEYNTRP
jgi:hypothetical protein